jgi:hypothetical protein
MPRASHATDHMAEASTMISVGLDRAGKEESHCNLTTNGTRGRSSVEGYIFSLAQL